MRITGRQLRQIIKEEVNRMISEAPDLERKKIDLLTAIASGRIIDDRNSTADERLTINAMLDDYINKSGNKRLEPFLTSTLPDSPFGRKLRAVQTDLGIGVDGRFGERSIMGIVRATTPSAAPAQDIQDVIDMIQTGGGVPRSPSAAELGSMVDRSGDRSSYDLGPGIVGSTGTGTTGVAVTPVKVGPSSPPRVVKQEMLRIFGPMKLADVKRTALAMQARGQDPLPYLRKELGAQSKELGAMQADLLLTSLDIKPQN